MWQYLERKLWAHIYYHSYGSSYKTLIRSLTVVPHLFPHRPYSLTYDNEFPAWRDQRGPPNVGHVWEKDPQMLRLRLNASVEKNWSILSYNTLVRTSKRD